MTGQQARAELGQAQIKLAIIELNCQVFATFCGFWWAEAKMKIWA